MSFVTSVTVHITTLLSAIAQHYQSVTVKVVYILLSKVQTQNCKSSEEWLSRKDLGILKIRLRKNDCRGSQKTENFRQIKLTALVEN